MAIYRTQRPLTISNLNSKYIKNNCIMYVYNLNLPVSVYILASLYIVSRSTMCFFMSTITVTAVILILVVYRKSLQHQVVSISYIAESTLLTTSTPSGIYQLYSGKHFVYNFNTKVIPISCEAESTLLTTSTPKWCLSVMKRKALRYLQLQHQSGTYQL